ncbi:hypothetical protein AB0A74_07110 [Saccharothrix sp. NPDC042600]|uniref:hypothetical protein n=1 Tax=Saccharothrix TaxID=2071 RepID=UPI0033CDDADD|nr:hypothetical protein GCM10017745_30560 [Saccharothrix mutabilis subsp. capreolus]
MARERAFIDCAIWDDPDFVALSGAAQRLYFFLLSQRDLNYAGLLPLRLRRWASRLRDEVKAVEAALAELHAARFVISDQDAEEALVRSLIRRDGIWKQPQIMVPALREAFEITSPTLRAVLADELRRLPVDVVGEAPGLAVVALLSGATVEPPAVKAASEARLRRGKTKRQGNHPAPDNPAPDPAGNPSPHPSPNPAGHPPADPSGEPSAQAQGVGGGGKEVVVPVQMTPGSPGGNAPAPARVPAHGPASVRVDAPTREAAERLVAEHLPGRQPGRVTVRLVAEVAGLLGEGIAPDDVGAGLRLWAGKRLGVGLLPELVGEAMRAPTIEAARLAAHRSRGDDRVGAAFALAARYAVEDGDDTGVGRALRAAAELDRHGHDADGPPGALGVLVAAGAA